MSTAPIQRAVTFPGRFDTRRIIEIAEKRRKGPKQGRYHTIYEASTNLIDHSIDAGDLLWALKDGAYPTNDRYMDLEQGQSLAAQQPVVSSNLRGLIVSEEKYQEYALDGGGNDTAIKMRAARDMITVVAVARYNCLYNPDTTDQKDPALMVAGTIDSVVQHNMRTGDLVMWDVPNPEKTQKAGTRDIKKLDKIRVELVPIRSNARITIEELIEWCEKVGSEAALQHFRDTDPDTWIDSMRAYMGADNNKFWTKEGEFMFELYRSQRQFQDGMGMMLDEPAPGASQQQRDDHMVYTSMMCFDRWLKIIHKAKKLKHFFNQETRDIVFTAINGDLYAQVKVLLDCLGRLCGKISRSAEYGGYADWVVELM